MRTWITIITICVVLSVIVITEQIYISDFKNEIESNVSMLKDKIHQKTVATEDVLKLERNWNKSKNIIYIFANHNSFITLENAVSLMKNYVKNKNYDKLYVELLKFKNCINDFDESRKFTISNIL